MAKLHIRHLVGGRSALAEHERLFRFEFPERPGALMNFLNSMSPHWNISLFHYRNHGCGLWPGARWPAGAGRRPARPSRTSSPRWCGFAEGTDHPPAACSTLITDPVLSRGLDQHQVLGGPDVRLCPMGRRVAMLESCDLPWCRTACVRPSGHGGCWIYASTVIVFVALWTKIHRTGHRSACAAGWRLPSALMSLPSCTASTPTPSPATPLTGDTQSTTHARRRQSGRGHKHTCRFTLVRHPLVGWIEPAARPTGTP